MTVKVLIVDPEQCTGCHSCEMACSMKHFGKNHPDYSRIKIHEFRDVNTFVPVVCQACEEAPCIKACPKGSRLRLESGAVITNEDTCTGCRVCISICHAAAPVINPDTGKPMTCNQCAGDEAGPWCVKACAMQGALLFVPKNQVSKVLGRKFAWALKEEYKPKSGKEEKQFGFGFA